MACYLCGAPTPSGKAYRRKVQTGTAYTGWGITKNPTVNALLSGVKRGPRRFYSLRTLCRECAMRYDSERKNHFSSFIGGMLAIIVVVMMFVVLIARHP